MKTIIIFILSFVVTSSVFAQATTIPDVNFEQKLVQLGIDSDGLNGQILNTDASAVTKLDISSSLISSLTGIHAFTNLDTLICSDNDVVIINTTNNTLLRYLNCETNFSLVSLNVTGNSALTYLNCNDTEVSSVNITANTALEHFECSSSEILNLNLVGNPSLRYLNCEDMDVSLTSLDVTGNPSLEYLNCKYNNLTTLDLTSNTVLEYLNCASNPDLINLNITNCANLKILEGDSNYDLVTVDVTGNPLLEYLNLANSSLTSLDITGNPLLEYLDCNNSDLTSLDVTGSPLLEYLNCQSNSITSLDVTGNPLLEYLNCQANSINSLDITTNSLLKKLFCGENNISTLDYTNLPLLEESVCGGNNLTTLDLSANPLLDYFICGENYLTSLDVSNNPLLEWLGCYDNDLIDLDVSAQTGLSRLDCQGNNLRSLNVMNNPMLRYLSCEENNLTELLLGQNSTLAFLYCQDNQLESLDITGLSSLSTFYCRSNLPYLRICVRPAQNFTPSSKDPSAEFTIDCYPFAVKGKVVVDNNLNCLVDTIERGLSGQWLKFEKTTDTTVFYFTTYDTLGNYRAYLDTGTYTVSILPSSSYWAGCPASQSVTIGTSYVIQTLDWSLQEVISCALLEVDIAAPYLRSTGGGSAYTVSYCNNGTATAQGAYAVVDLDQDLNFISSTTPVLSQNGSVYTFFIGDVGVGFCGSFQIQVAVDTSAQFEQTHCTDLHIYPDSICLPLWAGPIVDGAATCQNDTVQFDLNNIGTLMPQTQNYTVIQDDIAMRTGVIQLGAGQSTTIMEPALPGSTYRIEVEQSSGYPIFLGDSVFSSAIEGCNPFPNGTFNTGFITQFSNGYSSPFRAIDCQPNIASYDPNDKSAQPVGYGSQHYISQNIAIDYKVRFQNTGTDTAFNIVITDTLSTYLDVFSLEMGASSHNYTWTVENGNVIKVSFPNIMLVDSNANEPLSHGFFRYRISQKLNNPLGSLIENQAAIYFDFNPPIFTNTTFHTVGENFVPLVLTIEHLYEESVKVTAFPNPFDYSTTIEVKGKEYNELELSVFDVSGRMVREKQTSSSNQIQLSRGNLKAGVYFYKLKGDKQLLNTGKLIVQ